MAANRIEVDFGIWGIMRKVAVTLFVTAILGALFLWYIPIIRQTNALQKEIESKRESLKRQQELHQKYNDELHALRTDPEAVEKAIREKLGLAKPNEKIYYFESSSTTR